MNDFLLIVLIFFGFLQIILFFKLWGMCNDVRELKKTFVKEPNSNEISNLDEWLEGGEAKTKNYDENITIGAEVSATVDKNGVHAGDVMKVVKTGKGFVICAVDGKPVGKFSTNEVFLIK